MFDGLLEYSPLGWFGTRYTKRRLTSVFKTSEEENTIPIDFSKARIILFSDCHRGDNSWSDEFADNQNTFFHALKYYLDNEFTLIEVGDGEELWENKKFTDIREGHSHVYWLMSKFHEKERFHKIWGNHDIKWRKPKKVAKYLYGYTDERTMHADEESDPKKDLFKNIKVTEGLILESIRTGKKVFVTHGHQGTLFSDSLWWVGKVFVRNIWRVLQAFFGWKDPTSPAKNNRKRKMDEKNIMRWINSRDQQMIIVGHTHRPAFPARVEDPQYFNCGSGVHPRCITGLEIYENKITLVKWSVGLKDYAALEQKGVGLKQKDAPPGKGAFEDTTILSEAPLCIMREELEGCSWDLASLDL